MIQNTIDDLKNALTDAGFKYRSSCHCSGMMTWKYALMTDAGEFKINLRKHTFKLFKPTLKSRKDVLTLPNLELKNIIDEILASNKSNI